MVFGKEWSGIQLAPTRYVSEEDRVLIVGGGTGQLLEQIQCKQITYLELSNSMLEKAKKRTALSNVTYVLSDFNEWSSDHQFNKIIFPFFLDCFQEDRVNQILAKSKHLIVPNGSLIVLDFQKSSWWKDAIIKVMYVFFRLFSGLEGKKLLPITRIIQRHEFHEVQKQEFLDGCVFCGEYLQNTKKTVTKSEVFDEAVFNSL